MEGLIHPVAVRGQSSLRSFQTAVFGSERKQYTKSGHFPKPLWVLHHYGLLGLVILQGLRLKQSHAVGICVFFFEVFTSGNLTKTSWHSEPSSDPRQEDCGSLLHSLPLGYRSTVLDIRQVRTCDPHGSGVLSFCLISISCFNKWHQVRNQPFYKPTDRPKFHHVSFPNRSPSRPSGSKRSFVWRRLWPKLRCPVSPNSSVASSPPDSRRDVECPGAVRMTRSSFGELPKRHPNKKRVRRTCYIQV